MPPTAWCNVGVPAEASSLALPAAEEVAGPTNVAPLTNPREWVVVWASWCKPCEAEWPHIERALGLLGQQGIAVRLTLLSIDTDAGALATYLRAHPELTRIGAHLLRARSADAVEAWARRQGLSATGAGLPFHLLASSDGKLACVHAGPLLDEDVALVSRLAR